MDSITFPNGPITMAPTAESATCFCPTTSIRRPATRPSSPCTRAAV